MQWTSNLINPYTPKVDKYQISPAASPDIYITTGFMKNLASNSLPEWKIIILLILTTLYCTFELFKGWVNVLFELWSEMVNAQYIVQCADSVWWQKIWISFPAQDFSHSGATGGILYPKPEKGDPAETLRSWGISGWGILESSFVHGTVQCKPSL